MPRPKQLVTRDRQLNLSLTPDEFALLKTRADAVGLRLSEYARAAVLNRTVKLDTALTTSRFDRLVYRQWARVGANLNQVARRLNALGAVSGKDVEAVLAELRQLMAEARS